MFVQVIQGRVRDSEGLRRQVESWQQELAPGATGWLGATSGETADGQFIAVVRFESEEAARRNSERPEQTEWWNETQQYLEGDVTFHDCPEVMTIGQGGSDDAGFVQVIQGRTTDVPRLKEIFGQLAERLPQLRPDLIGVTAALCGDFVNQTAYFRSEQEAREREAAMESMSDEDRAGRQEWMSLMQDLRYLDLSAPRLNSP